MAQEDFFNDDSLPDVKRFRKKAEESKDRYFCSIFGSEEEAAELPGGKGACEGGIDA